MPGLVQELENNLIMKWEALLNIGFNSWDPNMP
jgi:hypothetical protein